MDIGLKLRVELDSIKTEILRRALYQDCDDLQLRLQNVVKQAKEKKFPEIELVALIHQAEIYLDRYQVQDAIDILDQTDQELLTWNKLERHIDLLVLRARTFEQLNHWLEASETCGRGIEIVEEARKKVSPRGLQSAYLRFKIRLYEIGVRAAFELGDYNLALHRAELAKCSSARKLARGLNLIGDNGLTKEWISETTLHAEYRNLCVQLDSPDLTVEGRKQLIAKRRTVSDRLMILRSREYTDDQEKENYSHTDLQQEEALIYYFWTGPRTLLIFAATNKALHAEKVDLSEKEWEIVKIHTKAILNFRPGEGRLRVPSRLLSTLLLPQKIIQFVSSVNLWIISPHRNLHMIPFHALPTQNGFVIDQYALAYAPNLESAVLRHPPALEYSFCGIGVRQTEVLAANGRHLSELSNAEEEINIIARIFQQKKYCLIGADACEARLRVLDKAGECAKISHWHFACHGTTIDSNTPLESWLALSDTALDGLDIMGFHLNAELVYLSGCCSGQRPVHLPVVGGSGRLEELPGDEIFGLPAAFFYAGTKQVISTLWAVDSEPAQKISEFFYLAYLKGASAVFALREAILIYRDQCGLFFDDPDKWAPFFITVLSRPKTRNQGS